VLPFFQQIQATWRQKMAKCPICGSRKGKRNCQITNTLICSVCCGNTRNIDACSACSFYQKPKRKYGEVPAYSVSEMSDSENELLEAYGNAIEGALCAFDFQIGERLNDSDAIKIIELLIDKYHFQDMSLDQEPQFIANGFLYVDEVIQEDLKDVEKEEIVKILGVIRFVARRRTRIGREYMNIIHQYVGQRIDTGIRVLPR
jgi:hypothetical protein